MVWPLLMALLLWRVRREHPELFDGALALEQVDCHIEEQSRIARLDGGWLIPHGRGDCR